MRAKSGAYRMAAVFAVWMQLLPAVSFAGSPAAGSTPNFNPNPGVFPIHSHPYGLSYGEWSAKWWQWAYGIPAGTNPILDTTGADCGLNQAGPVWFLAGTAGTAATRACTVPAGKSILFPIIDVVNDYPCPDPNFHPAPGQTLKDFLTQGAQGVINQVTELDVEVDGVAIRHPFIYRATSNLFTFVGDLSMAAAFDPCITGTRQPGVADGYWIMLAPLSPGAHTIHFRSAGPFDVEVTYSLTVAG